MNYLNGVIVGRQGELVGVGVPRDGAAGGRGPVAGLGEAIDHGLARHL